MTDLPDTLFAEPIELRFAGDRGVVSGYASTFGGEADFHGDVIAAGAFVDSLAKHKAAGTMPPMLWAHQQSRPVGRWTALVEDAYGLRVEGALNLATEAGREAFQHLKAGDLSGLSIGFRMLASSPRPGGGGRLITKVDLAEISIVAVPSNGSARISGVKAIGSRRELEDVLHRKAGLSRSLARKIAGGGWPALATAEAPNIDTIIKGLKDAARNLRGTK